MASGALTPQNTRATPSTARDSTRTSAEVANAPAAVPATMTTTAATTMFLAPKRRAKKPVGSDRKMPASVNTDMSIEAEPTSISNCSMMAGMIEGTLNCPSATAMPASTSSTDTSTWFWYAERGRALVSTKRLPSPQGKRPRGSSQLKKAPRTSPGSPHEGAGHPAPSVAESPTAPGRRR